MFLWEERAVQHHIPRLLCVYLCTSYVVLSPYSTQALWMHQFKDVCLWLAHICLEFHLFHPVFWFPNNPLPLRLPAVPYFIVPWNPFKGWWRGQCRPQSVSIYRHLGTWRSQLLRMGSGPLALDTAGLWPCG